MSKGHGPGRDGAKEQFWRKLVNGFDPERTTVRQWCADHSVSEPSFYGWRRELKRRDRERAQGSGQKQRVQLLSVKVAPSLPAMTVRPTKLIVRLANGVRLYVTVEQLPAVLDVLTSASSVKPEARSC